MHAEELVMLFFNSNLCKRLELMLTWLMK